MPRQFGLKQRSIAGIRSTVSSRSSSHLTASETQSKTYHQDNRPTSSIKFCRQLYSPASWRGSLERRSFSAS